MTFGTRFALFAVALGCMLPSQFADAQDWTSQGSIRSRQYQNQIRGDSGVEATEFFTLEYSVSIRIQEVRRETTMMDWCMNTCKGKKHKNHGECDKSCDDACEEDDHEMTVEGEYVPDRGAMGAATAAANGLAVQGGGTVSPNDWSHRVSQALAAFKRECKKKVEHKFQHAGPCSMQFWEVGRKVKTFTVRGTMTKVGFRRSRGVDTPINQTVGVHEHTVATGYIPADEPFTNENDVACACTAPAEPEESIEDFLIRMSNPNASRTRADLDRLRNLIGSPTGVQFFDESGKLKFRAEVDTTCTGNDMNTMRLLLTNNSGETVRVVLPPGVRFVPANSAYQVMACLVRTETLLRAGESREVCLSVGEPPLYTYLTEEATVRWACMEMEKKEPDPSVKYRISSERDNTLTRLAEITNASRFRGPHDQARMWIYTDKAPREEINKRMIPGVSPAMYTLLLRDVAQKGGVDLSKPGYLNLATPDLLSAVNFDDGAVRWLVTFLARYRTKDLASYVNGKASTLAELAGKEGKDGPANLTWIVESLLAEDSVDLQKGAAKVLLEVAVPQRPVVAEAGALNGLRALFASGNEELSKIGLDVLEAYGTVDAKQLAMACIEAMPTDPLKVRAAKFAGVEWSSP